MSKVQTDPSGDTPTTFLSPTLATLSAGIARSPSHESFATDLSLMSLSSLGSDMPSRPRPSSRGATTKNGDGEGGGGEENSRRSPRMMEGGLGGWASAATSRGLRGGGARGGLLQVPAEGFGSRLSWRPLSGEVVFEEESEMIRSCGALSSVLGLMKSFSTSDIAQAASMENEVLRQTVSELALYGWGRYILPLGRLDYASRSCSTWVAVGDMSSTSQLPSPHAQSRPLGEAAPSFTAADLILSVNKKVRQMYIHRRVISTYKALERLTRSQLNLDTSSNKDGQPASATTTPVTTSATVTTPTTSTTTTTTPTASSRVIPQVQISTELDRSIRNELDLSALGFCGAGKTLTLTVKDIERQRGKPLTKYERNMMIFNWLHSLDESAFDQLS